MSHLTERQEEYLLLFAMRNGQDKCISEAAELFRVSKPSAFSVTEMLEARGMIQKGTHGEVRLTKLGWDYIHGKLQHQRELSVWLSSGLGLAPVTAEQEARRMVTCLSPETLEAILRHWRAGEAAIAAASVETPLSALPPGVYEVPFLVCKKDSREASMGDRGFCKPAVLIKKECAAAVQLRPKDINYKPDHKKPLRGSLARMWYRRGGAWHETKMDESGSHVLPGEAIRCEEGPDGTAGIIRIRARASVGILGMPESEADIVFFLEQIREMQGLQGKASL